MRIHCLSETISSLCAATRHKEALGNADKQITCAPCTCFMGSPTVTPGPTPCTNHYYLL